MSRPPTYTEIRRIAHEAVSLLADHGYECCLFGSTACALWGATRCPNDVDLIVLSDDNPEYIKGILADENQNFFLVPSLSRNADYEVLWYQLPSSTDDSYRVCKVDILIPGDGMRLNIPRIDSHHVKYQRRLPVVPLLPLLLLKLQGWTDHRDSNRPDMQEKQYVDVEDIEELLAITCDQRTHIGSRSLSWLAQEFVDAAQQRIYEYVEEFPESSLYWQDMGFDT